MSDEVEIVADGEPQIKEQAQELEPNPSEQESIAEQPAPEQEAEENA